jgi:hypothetical protein
MMLRYDLRTPVEISSRPKNKSYLLPQATFSANEESISNDPITRALMDNVPVLEIPVSNTQTAQTYQNNPPERPNTSPLPPCLGTTGTVNLEDDFPHLDLSVVSNPNLVLIDHGR